MRCDLRREIGGETRHLGGDGGLDVGQGRDGRQREEARARLPVNTRPGKFACSLPPTHVTAGSGKRPVLARAAQIKSNCERARAGCVRERACVCLRRRTRAGPATGGPKCGPATGGPPQADRKAPRGLCSRLVCGAPRNAASFRLAWLRGEYTGAARAGTEPRPRDTTQNASKNTQDKVHCRAIHKAQRCNNG